MRVVVDQERCCGSGECVLAAPSVFDQAPNTGVVLLLTEAPPPAARPAARQAARLCPVAAIAVVEP